MKRLLVVLLLLVSAYANAQMVSYYPNGTKTNIKHRTIKQLMDSLGVDDAEGFHHSLGEVYFKKFTQRPLFIIFWDNKIYPTRIKEMVAAYAPKYNEYIYSYSYFADLARMIKGSKLTDSMINQTFGKPDIILKKEESDSTKVFFNYNCQIDYKEGVPFKADVINYRDSFFKYKLFIDAFSVYATDYSIGFDISFTNYDKRTIKYLYIAAVAKNPVKDVVGRKTFTAVGPIKKDQIGSYSFKNGISTTVGEYLAIESIKVLYMDGSSKLLSKLDIRKITKVDWEEVGQYSGN